MKQPKLNLELLRKVRDRIAEIPESYDQANWRRDGDAPCGTAACLAGETIIVSAPTIAVGVLRLKELESAYDDETRISRFDSLVADEAATLLGISDDDAGHMFTVDGGYHRFPLTVEWPEPHRSGFQSAQSNNERAQVAVAYLDECLRRKAVTW